MNVCIYCGEVATSLDHLMPVAWFEGSHRSKGSGKRNKLRGSVPTVDCCNECNTILGDKFIPNLIDRVKFVGETLIRREAGDTRIAFNARMLYELENTK